MLHFTILLRIYKQKGIDILRVKFEQSVRTKFFPDTDTQFYLLREKENFTSKYIYIFDEFARQVSKTTTIWRRISLISVFFLFINNRWSIKPDILEPVERVLFIHVLCVALEWSPRNIYQIYVSPNTTFVWSIAVQARKMRHSAVQFFSRPRAILTCWTEYLMDVSE